MLMFLSVGGSVIKRDRHDESHEQPNDDKPYQAPSTGCLTAKSKGEARANNEADDDHYDRRRPEIRRCVSHEDQAEPRCR